jgi:hypothetical protein
MREKEKECVPSGPKDIEQITKMVATLRREKERERKRKRRERGSVCVCEREREGGRGRGREGA